MKKRVGIITLYHNSQNYGGLLQAYALVKILKLKGYDAEQIDFDNQRKDLLTQIKIFIKKSFDKKEKNFINEEKEEFLKQRKSAIKYFREEHIPHSKNVYTYDNLDKLNSIYDIFICGSDQIWNYYRSSAYYLTFVKDNKIKFSYAAGMSNINMNKKDLKWTFNALSRLDGVSVREKETKNNFFKLNKDIRIVLDPTLLISEVDWRKISLKPNIKEKYLLCYFLSPNSRIRELATDFAQINNYRVVTIPYINKSCYFVDDIYGDIKLSEVDPLLLLGLIDNAEVIFTDSFHVSLFSLLFKKELYCFSRIDYPEMDVRIDNLFELFEVDNSIINISSSSLENKIFKRAPLSYSKKCQKLEKMKINSNIFLEEMLNITK